MRWIAALSEQVSLEAALQDVVTSIRSRVALEEQFSGEVIRWDLGVIFVSSAFASEYKRVLPLLRTLLPLPVIIGCSGGGIVGNGQEVEAQPAIALTLAQLPGVAIEPFYVEAESLPDSDAPPDAWYDVLGLDPALEPQFVLLSDGFGGGALDLVQGLDFAYPQSTKVGGLASGGQGPGQNGLFLQERLYRTGTVGIALSGNIELEAVVAQGCRPIGKPLLVTEAERNVVLTLDQEPPLKVLQKLVQTLGAADQQLVQHSLFVGLVMDQFKAQPQPGDFLIRNLLGIDPRTGAIAIGDRIRAGQTIQFHLRDAATSAADLEWVLERYCQTHATPPAGCLMFSCLGRGEYLYAQPNFDSETFARYVGQSVQAGFFCNGEIGPVGGTTFLHGYTSVFGLFRARHS